MYMIHNFSVSFTLCRSSRKNVSSSTQSDTAHPLRTSSQPAAISSMPSSSSSASSILVPSSSSPPGPGLNKKQLAYARTKTAHGKPFKSPPTKARKHRANQRSKEAPGCLSPKSWKSVPARVVSTHLCTYFSTTIYVYVYVYLCVH